jgi:hypothetical protein
LEIPPILKAKLRLFGVKTTLKSVAEKLELDMHGFSDLDSMRRSSLAATKGRAVAASASSDFESDRRMVGGVSVCIRGAASVVPQMQASYSLRVL